MSSKKLTFILLSCAVLACSRGKTKMDYSNLVPRDVQPSTLTSRVEMLSVRSSHLVRFGNEWLLTGNQVPSMLQPAIAEGSLRIVSLGTLDQEIEGPSGKFLFIHPQSVVSQNKEIHLIWGESSTTAQSDQSWLQPMVDELWTANRSAGGIWDTPTRLYAGAILWDKRKVGSVASHATRSAIAVPVLPTEHSDAGLLVAVRHDGRWTVQVLPSPGAVQSSLTFVAGSIAIAYVAAGRAGGLQPWTVRELSRGTWADPQQVDLESPESVSFVTLLGGSALHLVFGQRTSLNSARIGAEVSRDGGVSWQSTGTIETEGMLNSPAAAIDASGSLHLVYENYPHYGGKGSLMYVQCDQSWTRPRSIYSSFRAVDPTLGVDPDGNLVVAMLAQPATAEAGSPYHSMVSTIVVKRTLEN